jgi:hypothetical protein
MTTTRTFDAAAVRARLRSLAAHPFASRVFGSDEHRFVLHPPLSAPTTRRHERRNRIALPAAYRQFVLEIGDGGAGPGYGLFRLRAAMQPTAWRGGDLSRPFRHRAAWNLPEAEAILRAIHGPARTFSRVTAAWSRRQEAAYWSPTVIEGAAPMAHHGCRMVDWLVVTGPETGTVWQDLRDSYAGLRPYERSGRRMDFVDWYEAWLAAASDRAASPTSGHG